MSIPGYDKTVTLAISGKMRIPNQSPCTLFTGMIKEYGASYLRYYKLDITKNNDIKVEGRAQLNSKQVIHITSHIIHPDLNH